MLSKQPFTFTGKPDLAIDLEDSTNPLEYFELCTPETVE
jgi:hypothetical protein